MNRFIIPAAHELNDIVPGRRWRVHDMDHAFNLGYDVVAGLADPDWWKKPGHRWPEELAYFATREEAVAWMVLHEPGRQEEEDGLRKEFADLHARPKRPRKNQDLWDEEERTGKRICSCCGMLKPLNFDNFSRSVDARHGFISSCKPCNAEKVRRQRAARARRKASAS